MISEGGTMPRNSGEEGSESVSVHFDSTLLHASRAVGVEQADKPDAKRIIKIWTLMVTPVSIQYVIAAQEWTAHRHRTFFSAVVSYVLDLLLREDQ
jgi:hypothetical protein